MPDPDPVLPLLLLDLADTLEVIQQLEARKASLLARLDALRETGQVTDKVSGCGLSITWSPGRKTYDYPDDVLALKAQLKQAMEVAETTGTAIRKPLTPFWTVRPAKS